MKPLIDLLAENEDWLLNRVFMYAQEHGFSRYTSTLPKDWRVSIKELTAAIIGYLRQSSMIPELSPHYRHTEDTFVTFSVKEAAKHRERGVAPGMFLGLLKYYRQSYLDLAETACFDHGYKVHALRMIARIFDRMEIALSNEWGNLRDKQIIQELQAKSRMLTNEKNMYLTLFQSLPTPALFFNQGFALIKANDAAVQMFSCGETPDENDLPEGITTILARQFAGLLASFFAADNLESDAQMELDTAQGKKYFKAKLRRMLDIGGKFEGILVILSDITALYTSEQRLRQSNERFQLLFNSGSDAIFVYNIEADGQPGTFMEVNEIACRMLGLDQEIMTTLTICDIVAPKYQRDIMSDIHAITGYQQLIRRMSLKTAYGSVVEVEVSSRIFERGGKKSVLSIARNITEKMRLEAEMQRLSQMHLVGEMAAGLGHELRNPMTTVRGFLQFLQEKENREKVSGYYTIMIEELDRANGIITEYLNLAKNKAITLTEININDIVTNLAPLIQSDAILANHKVEVLLCDISAILADEKEMCQLVLNLCRNGLEAMDSAGQLTIETYMEGKSVVLAVGDAGTGIPLNLQNKIGTPFFTTKSQGVGLGLAICYSIAARNSAKIDFSTSSHGTTFYVKFTQ